MVSTGRMADAGRKAALLLAGYAHAVAERRTLLARPKWSEPARAEGSAGEPGEPGVGPDVIETPFVGGLRGWSTAPPRVVTDAEWASLLRRFARGAVWTIPLAAVLSALSVGLGWPTPGARSPSPGFWLAVTVFALVAGLIGVVAVTALLAATPGRHWALAALLATVPGTLLFAPALGLLGVARSAVADVAGRLSPDAAVDLDGRFFHGTAGRWLLVGGLALLAIGWFALGCAVAASAVLNRADGELIIAAVGVAVLGAYLSWPVVVVLAAMPLLAAGLGLAWTASRLAPHSAVPHEAVRVAEEYDPLPDAGDIVVLPGVARGGKPTSATDRADRPGDRDEGSSGGSAVAYRERLAGQHILRTREFPIVGRAGVGPSAAGGTREGIRGGGDNRGRAHAAGDHRSG